MYSIAPTQAQVFAALTGFLRTLLGGQIEIVKGQVNRVPEPKANDFIVMWPLRRERLATNVDSLADCQFTASISGTLMNVSAVTFGVIALGARVFGTGLLGGSGPLSIQSIQSGVLGGPGIYVLSGTAAASSQIMASGSKSILQSVNATFQLDVHGPASAENAQAITSAFRDEYALDSFSNSCVAMGLDPLAITPLLADDPKQVPFINDQNQYENRWVIEAQIEIEEVLSVPLQYFTALLLGLKEVDAVFPP